MRKSFEQLSPKVPPQEILNETSSAKNIERLLKLETEAFLQTRRIEDQVVITALEVVIDEQIKGSFFENVPVFVRNLKRTIVAGIFALGLNFGDVFASEKTEQSQFTSTQTHILESITGETFAELSKKFEVQMLVEPDASEKYVIHIGQTHQHPGNAIFKSMTQNEVVKKQKAIEDLIQKIIKANGLDGIFVEAVGNDTSQIEERAYIREAIKEIDAVYNQEIHTSANLLAAYNVYEKYQQNVRHPKVYHYLGSKLSALREKILIAVKDDKIVTNSSSEHEKLLLEIISNGLDLDKNLTELAMFGEQSDLYTVGIGFKLLMEDKIKYIYPAESADLNRKAFAAMKEREKANSEYSERYQSLRKDMMQTNNNFKKASEQRTVFLKKGEQNLTDEERAESEAAISILRNSFKTLNAHPELLELTLRLNQAKAEERRFIYTEREAEILRRIDFYDQKNITDRKSLGNLLLIYGSAHELTGVIKEWNAQNPTNSIDRGLIKIVPKN